MTLNPTLFCYWTGNNSMSLPRLNCFNSLKNSGLNVLLINSENLKTLVKYIGVDLHPGYKYLSEVHKADYLRCYVSHHLGGAYSDIKYINDSWIDIIHKFYKNENKWILGYKEIPNGYAITGNKQIDLELKNNWFKLIGCCQFVTKPKTPFTTEWYSILIKKMDEAFEQLKLFKARHPLEVYTKEYPYPFHWTELLGCIFHPLCLKYSDKISQDLPKFIVTQYR